MQITMIKGVPVTEELPKPTNQELQNEFNYILAEQMTKKLLDNGLITVDEYDKIMAKNAETFSPFIAKVIT